MCLPRTLQCVSPGPSSAFPNPQCSFMSHSSICSLLFILVSGVYYFTNYIARCPYYSHFCQWFLISCSFVRPLLPLHQHDRQWHGRQSSWEFARGSIEEWHLPQTPPDVDVWVPLHLGTVALKSHGVLHCHSGGSDGHWFTAPVQKPLTCESGKFKQQSLVGVWLWRLGLHSLQL